MIKLYKFITILLLFNMNCKDKASEQMQLFTINRRNKFCALLLFTLADVCCIWCCYRTLYIQLQVLATRCDVLKSRWNTFLLQVNYRIAYKVIAMNSTWYSSQVNDSTDFAKFWVEEHSNLQQHLRHHRVEENSCRIENYCPTILFKKRKRLHQATWSMTIIWQ